MVQVYDDSFVVLCYCLQRKVIDGLVVDDCNYFGLIKIDKSSYEQSKLVIKYIVSL